MRYRRARKSRLSGLKQQHELDLQRRSQKSAAYCGGGPENSDQIPGDRAACFYKDVETNHSSSPARITTSQMSAAVRLKSIFDNELVRHSFPKWSYPFAISRRAPLRRSAQGRAQQNRMNDAVKLGYGKLRRTRRGNWRARFRCHGRSLGMAAGEAIIKVRHRRGKSCPFVLFAASAAAACRGILSLMQCRAPHRRAKLQKRASLTSSS